MEVKHNQKSVKIILWFIGYYHLLFGVIVISPEFLFSFFTKHVLGATVFMTPQIELALNIFGAYIIGSALTLLFVAKNPIERRIFILPLLTTAIIEFIFMVLNFRSINEIFMISTQNIVLNLITSIFVQVALIIAFIKSKRTV